MVVLLRRSGGQHAGDETRQHAERGEPGCLVELLPGGRCGRVGGGCGGSRNARFSCMAALHVWRRLGMPAQESVDDFAKLEQITELAERRCAVHIVLARRCAGLAPVSPRGGNQRTGAVWGDDECWWKRASA